MSMQGPLQRPTTPSSRRASEFGRPSSQAGAGGHLVTGEVNSINIRPPTRSGSRPGTQESELRGSRKAFIISLCKLC